MRKKTDKKSEKRGEERKRKAKVKTAVSLLNPCASTACDIISFNGHGQLVATIKLVQSEEIFQTIPE